VTKIDSVFLNNQWHKRYSLSGGRCNGGFYKLIEGIGSTLGLFNSTFCSGGGSKTLICMSVGNKTVYPDSTYPTCQLITSVPENNIQLQVYSIYPNPTERGVHLSTTAKLLNIEVYNLQGQKVQEINPRKRKWEL